MLLVSLFSSRFRVTTFTSSISISDVATRKPIFRVHGVILSLARNTLLPPRLRLALPRSVSTSTLSRITTAATVVFLTLTRMLRFSLRLTTRFTLLRTPVPLRLLRPLRFVLLSTTGLPLAPRLARRRLSRRLLVSVTTLKPVTRRRRFRPPLKTLSMSPIRVGLSRALSLSLGQRVPEPL
jgi:hypothetical protein